MAQITERSPNGVMGPPYVFAAKSVPLPMLTSTVVLDRNIEGTIKVDRVISGNVELDRVISSTVKRL
jgi:hypothetical protein